MSNTVAFDPGYGQYLTSFINTIEYMYGEINKFKNLGQKKFKFKTYYPQILALIEQNTAFYLGCMLWAIYVKSQNNATLTGNHCLGQEYNEELELMEINYMIEFINHFNKDTKYYLNKTFDYSSEKMEILEIYIEFAKLNEGFVNSKMSDDIKLPSSIKIPSEENINKIYDTISKSVIPTGDFEKLYTLKDLII